MSSAMEPLPSTPLVCVLVPRTDNTGVLTFTQSHGALWLVLSTVNDTRSLCPGKGGEQRRPAGQRERVVQAPGSKEHRTHLLK